MVPNPSPPPCWGGILLCSWPVASMIGVLVQCFITAWRIDHKRPVRRRRQRDAARSRSRSRETREEARQRKYRYLYQVRTAHGDIISQVSSCAINILCVCVYVCYESWPTLINI